MFSKMSSTVLVPMLLDVLNGFIFGYFYELDLVAGAITVSLAGTGGYVLRISLESNMSWPSFAALFSLLSLIQGLVFGLMDGVGLETFAGYFLAWLAVRVPVIFCIVWMGSVVGQFFITNPRKAER